MRVPFRQGIVVAPDNFLTLVNGQVVINVPGNEYVDVTLADGSTDYLITETTTIAAWPGPFTAGDSWVYWDIDTVNGALSYGYTNQEPVAGPTPPVAPVEDLHWFDTTKNQMCVYNATANRWIRKIRVFAAQVHAGNQLISLSINSPAFVGTQVGLTHECFAGSLVYDASGSALKRGDGKFFTTEDVATTGVGTSTRVKLEAVVFAARAAAPIPAYSMVRFIDFDTIVPATNMLADPGIYGMVEQDVAMGEVVNVFREGLVSNSQFGWGFDLVPVNTPVFVDVTGQITVVPQPSRAVGIVLGPNTLLLRSTIVDDLALVESAVTITSPTSGVVVTGETGPRSSKFAVTLTDDLASVEAMTQSGVVHRNGGLWSAGKVDLVTEVADVLQPSHGGTGSATLAGYVYAPAGTSSFTASETIPGSAISGDISGNAESVNGTVPVSHGGTGGVTREEGLNNLLPPQTQANTVLQSDGTNASWVDIPNGTVTSIGVSLTSPGLVVGNTPITSSGDISIGLTGAVASLATITSAGVLSLTSTGDVFTNVISSPMTSLNITNGDGASSAGITVDLPVLNAPAAYASVVTDEFGRVTTGTTTLDWSKVSNLPSSLAGFGIIDAYTKAEVDSHAWNWSSILSTPTTIGGYGITDAYTKAETDALPVDWSRVTATPSTLAGYGITDSVTNAGGVFDVALKASINKPAAGTFGRVFIDTTLNTLSYDNGSQWIDLGNSGTVTSVGVTSSSSSLVVSNSPIVDSGNIVLSLAGNLAAVDGLATAGYAARRTNGTWRTSYILGTTNNITVLNGDGDINTTIDLADIGTAGTYYNVTTDNKGRVTSGSNTVAWAAVTGQPTTVAGYGITDAVTSSQVGAANGVASLDSTGKIPTSQLPALALSETFVVNSDAEMTALTAQQGDIAIRLDVYKTFVLTNNTPTVLANWQEVLASAAGGGSSVSYINATSNTSNLVISGGPILDMGTLQFSLAGNLAGVAGIASSGVAKVSGGVWSASAVNMAADVTGVLPVSNGGTGANFLTGYVKGNGNNAMTASATIPGADITGDISGNAHNVNGVVGIANGGTGASTQAAALVNILPLQTGSAVLYTNGTAASWASTIAGSMISGAVANATTAANADALGGYPASNFLTTTGDGATGTWNISITGSAAQLGGIAASNYALANGSNVAGTWNINTTGDAGSVGGKSVTQLASADGSNASGTWSINTTGTATNVSGVVTIAHGGTGATTRNSGLNALLPVQSGSTNNMVLTSNGADASWRSVADILGPQGYTTVYSGFVAMPQQHNITFASPYFNVSDNGTYNSTVVELNNTLIEIVDGDWVGSTNIQLLGTITSGTWNGTVIDIAHGGTGASTAAGAINALLPAQSGNVNYVLKTDGTNVSWSVPTVTFANVTSKPTSLSGYGITDAAPLTHTSDASLHLTTAQNTWIDAITATSAEVNYLSGVTSSVQTQLNGKIASTEKGVASGVATLDTTGKVPYTQVKGPVASSQTIAVGAYYEYDTWIDFGNSYDAKTLLISVKVLDSDNTSPTYNMYINSEAVATVAVKDSRYVRVYNDYTTSLTFHISVRP